jgi:prepilin peptidase CpaA
MRHALAIQTAGSLIVLSVFVLAELAARLLAHFPSSEFLWYLNQEVFQLAELVRCSVSPIRLLINQTTLYWALGGTLITLWAYRARWHFGAALISHFCLIVMGLVTYNWAIAMNLPKAASLTLIIAAFGQTNGAAIFLITGAALLSAIMAHLTYLSGKRSKQLDPNRLVETMTEVFMRSALAAILLFVIFDDLRNFRIRNEAIAALAILYVLRVALSGQYQEAVLHISFAALMFAVILIMYARGLMGGGDVKLLGVAFLWLGIENSFLFSLFLIAFTISYALLAKLGAVPNQIISAGTKIPFGPSIGAAWLFTLIPWGSMGPA